MKRSGLKNRWRNTCTVRINISKEGEEPKMIRQRASGSPSFKEWLREHDATPRLRSHR